MESKNRINVLACAWSESFAKGTKQAFLGILDVLISIYILCVIIVLTCVYFSSCHMWFSIVNFKLLSNLFNLIPSY